MPKEIRVNNEWQVCDFRYDEGIRGRTDTNIVPTLTTHFSGFSGTPLLIKIIVREKENTMVIRKLTPLECLRLMGFEDKDYKSMREIGMSDSQIYHCAGDSIVTTVLVNILFNLIDIPGIKVEELINNYVAKRNKK